MRERKTTFAKSRVELDDREQAELERATENVCRLYGCTEDELARVAVREEVFDAVSDLITTALRQLAETNEPEEECEPDIILSAADIRERAARREVRGA